MDNLPAADLAGGVLAAITIYPIKSLPGVSVPNATVLPSGALAGDRRWAIVDDQGRWVNSKRTAALHPIQAIFDLDQSVVSLSHPQHPTPLTANLATEQGAIAAWLSQCLGYPVHLQQNDQQGFPDDTNAPGPTLISTATLTTVTRWFPGLTTDNVRRRLRTNLEVAEVSPFWEDHLFGPDRPLTRPGRRFRIGDVHFLGSNPCQRCIVPTRDPSTGEAYPQFQRHFQQQRQATLPPTVARDRFNHFYRLAINTRLAPDPEGPTIIQVGDPVIPLAPTPGDH